VLYVKKKEMRDDEIFFFLFSSFTKAPLVLLSSSSSPRVSLSRAKKKSTQHKTLDDVCLRKTDSLLLETMNERREKLDARRQRSTRRRENVDFLLLLARARVRAYL
jgi:hypothetical protein